jgi:hypothetical protein
MLSARKITSCGVFHPEQKGRAVSSTKATPFLSAKANVWTMFVASTHFDLYGSRTPRHELMIASLNKAANI